MIITGFMVFKRFKIEIVEGVTEGISYRGETKRRQTVLLKIGKHSISKKAFQLGALLASFQLLDGFLTYLGVRIFGIAIEGNSFLQSLMHAYGTSPTLFASKILALGLVFMLTGYAHRRKWIRPIIAVLCLIYLTFAVAPWVYIISAQELQR